MESFVQPNRILDYVIGTTAPGAVIVIRILNWHHLGACQAGGVP